MTQETKALPLAVVAREVTPSAVVSLLPPALAMAFEGRQRRRLGEQFGLINFGVNLTRLAPGARSAFLHAHERQDEFIYIMEGCPTLITSEGQVALVPGMCAGFKAGSGRAHCLLNETAAEVWYLEIGDRTAGDKVHYPENDLKAEMVEGAWVFTRKDGSPL